MVTSETQSRRKRIKKKVQRLFPGRDIRWFHGRLYNFGPVGLTAHIWEPRQIEGVRTLPKEAGQDRAYHEVQASTSRSYSRPEGCAQAAPSRPACGAASKAIIFADLGYAADSDGECNKCSAFPNQKSIEITADEGRKFVVRCRNCGNVMRPHIRQRD